MALEERTRLLLGDEGIERLKKAHVILFGVGGVGGYTAEALARAGVGRLTLVDADAVSDSNRNRQIRWNKFYTFPPTGAAAPAGGNLIEDPPNSTRVCRFSVADPVLLGEKLLFGRGCVTISNNAFIKEEIVWSGMIFTMPRAM